MDEGGTSPYQNIGEDPGATELPKPGYTLPMPQPSPSARAFAQFEEMRVARTNPTLAGGDWTTAGYAATCSNKANGFFEERGHDPVAVLGALYKRFKEERSRA